MLRKKKICKGCQTEQYIFGHGLCGSCYRSNRSKKMPVKVKRHKVSGEMEVFKMIWEERPHHCQVCKVNLPVFDHWNYAHCLAKSTYNKFRLLKENIILMCRDCHTQYDTGSTKDDPKFEWVLELKQKLKMKYYGAGDTEI